MAPAATPAIASRAMADGIATTLNIAPRGTYRPRLLEADDPRVAAAQEEGAVLADSCPAPLPDGRWVDLPFLALPPDFDTAIAYLAINQASFEIEDAISTAMADMVRELAPEVVVGMPTFGMVLAAPVAKKLGHSEYVPLGYSRKFWYEDDLSEEVVSITSPGKPKRVFIDPRLLERLDGRRVLLVEDVISTGGTIFGELKLMERIGADVVGIVTAIKETNAWVEKLASLDPKYPAMVHAPIGYPLFTRADGGWTAVPGTHP